MERPLATLWCGVCLFVCLLLLFFLPSLPPCVPASIQLSGRRQREYHGAGGAAQQWLPSNKSKYILSCCSDSQLISFCLAIK